RKLRRVDMLQLSTLMPANRTPRRAAMWTQQWGRMAAPYKWAFKACATRLRSARHDPPDTTMHADERRLAGGGFDLRPRTDLSDEGHPLDHSLPGSGQLRRHISPGR